MVVVGTLLGPEGTGPAPGVSGWGLLSRVGAVGVLVPPARLCAAGWRGAGVGLAGAVPEGGRLYVENCTVDASIFFDCEARTRRVWGLL